MSRSSKRTYSGIMRNRKDRMARKLKPKVYEDQARPMFTAAITTSLPVQIIRGGRCFTAYRDITPGSKKSSKPMNESSASEIRRFANAYKDEPTAPTQYRCGLGVNEPRTLCHESPPEGTCGRVSLCIHTDLRIKISSQEKQVSRRSRKTRPIRAPFLILLFALILGLEQSPAPR